MNLLRHIVIAIILLLASFEVMAQDSLSTANKVGLTKRQKWIIAGIAAQQAASFYLEYKWWWEDNYHPFVIKNDGGFDNYSLGVDKVGHFYTSYMYSNLIYELMKWGEFSENTSEWVSVTLPFVWALSIELGDGFSKYAFNPDDLIANTIGIAYAFAQRRVPVLNKFKVKFSYFPSEYYRDRNMAGWSLTSDYDGHIYWLTMDVNGLLPKAAKPYWPKYLNLAAGYGIQNFRPEDPNTPGPPLIREFHIGLDYNLGALPAKKPGWQAIRNMVDYYHFPAPGFSKKGDESWKFKPLLLN
jgi:hypothetical protein